MAMNLKKIVKEKKLPHMCSNKTSAFESDQTTFFQRGENDI